MSLNKVQIIGRLGDDIEINQTEAGTSVTNFSIATNRSWKNKEGEKIEETEWHRVNAWDKGAETLGKYLSKGDQVYIEGRLKTDKYEDENGVEKYATKIVMENFRFLSNKKEGFEPQIKETEVKKKSKKAK